MEQQTQKKEWKTPELIVLVRSQPQEAVLAACKGNGLKAAHTTGQNYCVEGVGLCNVNYVT